MADASLSNGARFLLAGQRRSGFLGLFDDPPALIGGSLSASHISRRKHWIDGSVGVQTGWSHHGHVNILRLDDGSEIAAWSDEVQLTV